MISMPASVLLADPLGSRPVVSAVLWLQGTLLGTVATTIAVICVATVGLMMLSGRLDLRYGARVIVGCFLVFGASSIAAGIQTTLAAAGTDADLSDPLPPSPAEQFSPPAAAPLFPAQPPPPDTSLDPYAGAAVPSR